MLWLWNVFWKKKKQHYILTFDLKFYCVGVQVKTDPWLLSWHSYQSPQLVRPVPFRVIHLQIIQELPHLSQCKFAMMFGNNDHLHGRGSVNGKADVN